MSVGRRGRGHRRTQSQEAACRNTLWPPSWRACCSPSRSSRSEDPRPCEASRHMGCEGARCGGQRTQTVLLVLQPARVLDRVKIVPLWPTKVLGRPAAKPPHSIGSWDTASRECRFGVRLDTDTAWTESERESANGVTSAQQKARARVDRWESLGGNVRADHLPRKHLLDDHVIVEDATQVLAHDRHLHAPTAVGRLQAACVRSRGRASMMSV
jgi:hypothetical protein